MQSDNLITSIILIFMSFNIYSQSFKSFPKNLAEQDIYCYNDDTQEWTKLNYIDFELVNIKKEGKLKALQYKLKNLNYDVDISNRIDKKTTIAFQAEKNRMKNQKRNKRKINRKKRQEKRELNKVN